MAAAAACCGGETKAERGEGELGLGQVQGVVGEAK